MKDNVFRKGISRKYPEAILQERIAVEGSVVACVWKDPLLIDECKLSKKAFLTNDGFFFFCLAAKMRKKGLNVFDDIGVMTNCPEEHLETFEAKGGMEFIEEMTSSVDLSNWETYYDKLVREDNICTLYDHGFNVTEPMQFKGREIIPIELFRSMSSEDVLDFYEAVISDLGVNQSSMVLERETVELDDEWFTSLHEGTENGIPFDKCWKDINGIDTKGYERLSKSICGLLPGTTTMLGAYSSVGKSTWWVTPIMSLVSQGHKILIISNEERVEKFKQKAFVWMAANIFKEYKPTKKDIMSGEITEEGALLFDKIQKFWNENVSGKIQYLFIRDADIKVVAKEIRKYVLTEGYDVVLYDTFKIQESDMLASRQDLALVRDSRTLDKLAKKFDIVMLCSVQLAEHSKGKLWLDSSTLSNSKQIKEQLENLFLMRNVYEDEKDSSNKNYIRPFYMSYDPVSDKWIETEFEMNPDKCYKVLFLEKTRNGANSNDTNTAYLLRFDGDHSSFYEVARCRPKHGYIT